jgi:FKBP-type peptidyl-prolyl cis-trans isomerase FkpA
MLMATVVLFACNAGGKSDKKAAETSSEGADSGAVQREAADPDTSYAFGMVLGRDLRQTGLTFDYDELLKGFKDAVEGEPRFAVDEAISRIQLAYTEAMERQAELNKQKEAEFLAENGSKQGIATTASGLQYEVIAQGAGPRPGETDTVEVNYEGTFLDGTVFDSSYERGESTQFPLNRVIPGWSEGIQLMSIGSTYRLFIPAELAYGEQGAGNGAIPPNSTLIFKVELLSILE